MRLTDSRTTTETQLLEIIFYECRQLKHLYIGSLEIWEQRCGHSCLPYSSTSSSVALRLTFEDSFGFEDVVVLPFGCFDCLICSNGAAGD